MCIAAHLEVMPYSIGTNLYASQKGMSLGRRRYGADLTSSQPTPALGVVTPLQSGIILFSLMSLYVICMA